MTDGEFMATLSEQSIDPEVFNHAAHVRAAYLVLIEEPTFGRALDRIAGLIKAIAARHGNTTLYHETVTVAYMALINARLRDGGDHDGWDDFAAANGDLFERRTLAALYPGDTLKTPLSKIAFLLPGAA